MSNAAFWLVCLVSGAIAFAGVYYQGWRIFVAMIAGAGAALILSVPLLALTPAGDRSPWFQVELTMNASVGLIFAAAGSAIGFALRNARR